MKRILISGDNPMKAVVEFCRTVKSEWLVEIEADALFQMLPTHKQLNRSK